jgi:hypothetical protein
MADKSDAYYMKKALVEIEIIITSSKKTPTSIF